MTIATMICLALAVSAVFVAALRLPRLAVTLAVGTVDLSLGGQVFETIETDPLAVLASGAVLLTVLGVVSGTGGGVSTRGRDGRCGRPGS